MCELSLTSVLRNSTTFKSTKMFDNVADSSSSPPKSIFGRIPRAVGFLPLSSETVLSIRGQSLPGLIRDRSSVSLHLQASKLRRSGARDEEANDDSADEGRGSRAVNGSQAGRLGATAPESVTPKMRSMRLIGSTNPRYHWEQYLKTEEQLKGMRKPLREYYERTNRLVEQYMYIDRLLDSSLPHHLIQEYSQPSVNRPDAALEDSSSSCTASRENDASVKGVDGEGTNESLTKVKLKRTPKNLYRVPNENTPLLDNVDGPADTGPTQSGTGSPDVDESDEDDSQSIVQVAIYINLAANTVLLAAKIAVMVLTSSLSVLASLVDAVLDFLSTAVVWTTTRLMASKDQYAYPIGRRRLEPIGVLVFSVIIVTSFFQVLLESFTRLTSGDRSIVQLTLPAILIMASTVVVKFLCWLWCRLIQNSSVQALAQDAWTDVIFNIFSIIFPLVGFYARIWFLDALGGALLSLYIITTWTRTSTRHIRNLTGAAADSRERNILLYLTMRFAHAIRLIQGLQAYHVTEHKLIVEVDVVLDENTPLRDSHDLGESLQYLLESVPFVDRAFVHLDYTPWNLPTHMAQQ